MNVEAMLARLKIMHAEFELYALGRLREDRLADILACAIVQHDRKRRWWFLCHTTHPEHSGENRELCYQPHG